MARLPRVVVVDLPHHVTQRGNARQTVYDADRLVYLELLRQYSDLCGLALLVYCLMSNHVHLIAVPRASPPWRKLSSTRTGRPVENGFIESFNARLRDECLNVEWFVSLADARQKLTKFREHYSHERPHSALADRTPAAFAELHRRVEEKTSTSMGHALQNLFIESLECAKPA